jgi:hypothetical protein
MIQIHRELAGVTALPQPLLPIEKLMHNSNVRLLL